MLGEGGGKEWAGASIKRESKADLSLPPFMCLVFFGGVGGVETPRFCTTSLNRRERESALLVEGQIGEILSVTSQQEGCPLCYI